VEEKEMEKKYFTEEKSKKFMLFKRSFEPPLIERMRALRFKF
jgi:hypothetical protein